MVRLFSSCRVKLLIERLAQIFSGDLLMRQLIIIGLLIFASATINAQKPKNKDKTKSKQESSASVSYGDENLSVSARLFNQN